jgi:hypothetical protein
MTEAASPLEMLLREALIPIEPPEDLAHRLESALTSLTEIAAEELDSWELSAMRDPRNWARPAAALVVGSTAGVALVLLRARQRAQHTQRPAGVAGARDSAQRALHDLGDEARKLLGQR